MQSVFKKIEAIIQELSNIRSLCYDKWILDSSTRGRIASETVYPPNGQKRENTLIAQLNFFCLQKVYIQFLHHYSLLPAYAEFQR
jgi:hypothetical protein